jgi:small subunit ribosomal protein S13e
MGRLHSNGKGISASAVPYSRSVPTWFKSSPEQIVDNICKLAKKGATPSQIGVVLRDSHGVAQVKVVTGESMEFHGDFVGRERLHSVLHADFKSAEDENRS